MRYIYTELVHHYYIFSSYFAVISDYLNVPPIHPLRNPLPPPPPSIIFDNTAHLRPINDHLPTPIPHILGIPQQSIPYPPIVGREVGLNQGT